MLSEERILEMLGKYPAGTTGTVAFARDVEREATDELRRQLGAAQHVEIVWESTMMRVIGEDGPASVAEAIESLKLQRDTAWRELAAIRKVVEAREGESTLDEVKALISEAATLADRAQDYLRLKLAGDPLAIGVADELSCFVAKVDE